MKLQERLKGWMDYPAFNSEEFDRLGSFIASERKHYTIYPERDEIFRAFELTPPDKVRVVILGQDPYFDGNANGLAFACKLKVSPSLDKIIEVYNEDMKSSFAPDLYDGDLTRWAENGVLLLNSALTVKKGEPGSHTIAWKSFMKSLLSSIMLDQSPKYFIVMGNVAKGLIQNIDPPHGGIHVEHPAAACYAKRNWEAKGVFTKANKFLEMNGIKQIDW